MTRQWRNVGSVRALLGAFLVAAVPACLASLIAPVLFWVVGVPMFAAWMWFVQMAPDRVLYCPWCMKRVKAGADACHHCGRSV